VEMWKCHTTDKQRPIPDEDTQIFWEGCRRRRLLIQHCEQCGAFRFPPRPLCQACLGSLTTWHEEPGHGEVVTFCVYYAEMAGPAWRSSLPYIVVVVRLWYSGIHILSNLVCDDLQAVRIGIPVRVGFDVVHGALPLPKFFPLEGEAAAVRRRAEAR
jgi:uncharacterized OB-fold protein